MKIADALKKGKQQLCLSESASLDTEVLLCFVLNCDRSKLYSHPEEELTDSELNSFNEIISLRATGHPVAHLTRSKEFWSLKLFVTPDTLIPRPETELLVEAALNLIPEDKHYSILDLGTGSGAISIAIATERPLITITATDINEDTLNIAKKNAESYNIKSISFKKGAWFDIENISTYDLIVSNPPYVSINDPHLTQGDVRFESKTALVSGDSGLDDLQSITSNASSYLKPNGWILLEHGYQQGKAVRKMLGAQGFTAISTINDYSNQERVSIGQYMA